MCGIAACCGVADAQSYLIEALKRVEYRGYDSAGIAVAKNGRLAVTKEVGKVAALEALLIANPLLGTEGIGHTRWATNGPPTTKNAHPHVSYNGQVAVVHNGIVENEQEIREMLLKKGIKSESDTDTEVLSNLIAYKLAEGAKTLEDAVEQALSKVVGAYAIAVLSKDHEQIVGACVSSPLLVGMGDGGALYLASDSLEFAGFARHHISLEDGEIVSLVAGQPPHFRGRSAKDVDARKKSCTERFEDADKGMFPDFLLKEIRSQPGTMRRVLSGRLKDGGLVRLGGIERHEKRLAEADNIVLVACGTSYHAALVGKQLIEDLAGIPVEVQYAHEFRPKFISTRVGVIGVSQSGSTIDTVLAIQEAKKTGALCLGINNNVDSQLSRETGAGIYLHAGREISVASTKAFTAQVAVFALLALRLAQVRGVSGAHHADLGSMLAQLPELIEQCLSVQAKVEILAKEYSAAKCALFLGQGYCMPLAFEGALKLKEVAYINAEGYAAGELKHGPIALIEDRTPVVALVCDEGMVSSIEQVMARGAHVIAICNGDIQLPPKVQHVIRLPKVLPELTPIVGAIPLQLLARAFGVQLGRNVDQPRNLAKSVTVK